MKCALLLCATFGAALVPESVLRRTAPRRVVTCSETRPRAPLSFDIEARAAEALQRERGVKGKRVYFVFASARIFLHCIPG